jgi:hypothetical protein
LEDIPLGENAQISRDFAGEKLKWEEAKAAAAAAKK